MCRYGGVSRVAEKCRGPRTIEWAGCAGVGRLCLANPRRGSWADGGRRELGSLRGPSVTHRGRRVGVQVAPWWPDRPTSRSWASPQGDGVSDRRPDCSQIPGEVGLYEMQADMEGLAARHLVGIESPPPVPSPTETRARLSAFVLATPNSGARVAHMCRYALASRVRVLGELHKRNYLDPNL